MTYPTRHYCWLSNSTGVTALSGQYRPVSPLSANDKPVKLRDCIAIVKLQFANLRVIGSLSDLPNYLGNRIRCALQEKFYAAVIKIAHVPANILGLCMAHNKIAKADPLHSSRNKAFDTANHFYCALR